MRITKQELADLWDFRDRANNDLQMIHAFCDDMIDHIHYITGHLNTFDRWLHEVTAREGEFVGK